MQTVPVQLLIPDSRGDGGSPRALMAQPALRALDRVQPQPLRRRGAGPGWGFSPASKIPARGTSPICHVLPETSVVSGFSLQLCFEEMDELN